jgi:hypothetical protein
MQKRHQDKTAVLVAFADSHVEALKTLPSDPTALAYAPTGNVTLSGATATFLQGGGTTIITFDGTGTSGSYSGLLANAVITINITAELSTTKNILTISDGTTTATYQAVGTATAKIAAGTTYLVKLPA